MNFVIPSVDEDARAQALLRQTTLTKPSGALGRLENLSAWCAAVQGICPPTTFQHPALVIFAGDHGVARSSKVSAYPPEVTAMMVINFSHGGAAANVLAKQHNAHLFSYDISVTPNSDYLSLVSSEVRDFHVNDGSNDIALGDAISLGVAHAAFQAGLAIAARIVDTGADLFIPGDMGIGNTTAAAAVIGHFIGASAEETTGTGTGIDEQSLACKREVVGAAIERMRDRDPLAALASGSGADIVAMTATLIGVATAKIPILLDGVVSSAAAVAAEHLAPGVREWMVAGHRSTEPGQSRALAFLDRDPVLDLGMRLGEGSGALTALPIINSAIVTLAEMATFEQANVSDRNS